MPNHSTVTFLGIEDSKILTNNCLAHTLLTPPFFIFMLLCTDQYNLGHRHHRIVSCAKLHVTLEMAETQKRDCFVTMIILSCFSQNNAQNYKDDVGRKNAIAALCLIQLIHFCISREWMKIEEEKGTYLSNACHIDFVALQQMNHRRIRTIESIQ